MLYALLFAWCWMVIGLLFLVPVAHYLAPELEDAKAISTTGFIVLLMWPWFLHKAERRRRECGREIKERRKEDEAA